MSAHLSMLATVPILPWPTDSISIPEANLQSLRNLQASKNPLWWRATLQLLSVARHKMFISENQSCSESRFIAHQVSFRVYIRVNRRPRPEERDRSSEVIRCRNSSKWDSSPNYHCSPDRAAHRSISIVLWRMLSFFKPSTDSSKRHHWFRSDAIFCWRRRWLAGRTRYIRSLRVVLWIFPKFKWNATAWSWQRAGFSVVWFSPALPPMLFSRDSSSLSILVCERPWRNAGRSLWKNPQCKPSTNWSHHHSDIFGHRRYLNWAFLLGWSIVRTLQIGEWSPQWHCQYIYCSDSIATHK